MTDAATAGGEDLEFLKDWIGRTMEETGRVTAPNADVLSATFDRDDPLYTDGDAIPPGWHWYYFPEVVKLSETGPDGHAKRGGFMPPVPLPRRMWASNKMTFDRPLHIGEEIRRVSTITDVAPKTGRSGSLCFVTSRHEIIGENGLATTEEHTTVYRAPAEPGAPAPEPRPAPAEATFRRGITPTPVLLFRYSAVTMNSHRIHYDRPYTTEVEGYPGLLVHGPLIATMLLDHFRREKPAATLTSSSVRAVSPLYDIYDFSLEGRIGDDGASADVWALNHQGALAMQASLTFSE